MERKGLFTLFGMMLLSFSVVSGHLGCQWEVDTISSASGNVGWEPSLALGVADSPIIAYVDRDSDDLMYTLPVSGTWTYLELEIPDRAEADEPSLAFNTLGFNTLGYGIAYNDDNYAELRYAYYSYSDGSWSDEEVDSSGSAQSPRLVYDASNNPHISYTDLLGVLKYASFDGVSWKVEMVISDDASVSSLALDSSGNPAMSYYDGAMYDLMYVSYDGVSWNMEIVDDSSDRIGKGSSLAFDSSGNPAIAYHDEANGDLKYAYHDDGSWTSVVIDSDQAPEYSDIYGEISLVFDSLGNPAIAYYDLGNGDLRYASIHDGSWYTEAVDSSEEVGFHNSLVFNSTGHPAIAYYDFTNGNLKYATLSCLVEEEVRPKDTTPYKCYSDAQCGKTGSCFMGQCQPNFGLGETSLKVAGSFKAPESGSSLTGLWVALTIIVVAGVGYAIKQRGGKGKSMGRNHRKRK